MHKIHLSLLRGICQLPAYVAYKHNFFAEEGLEVKVSVTPTAWMIPEQLADGRTQFAVIPWTRVAAAEKGEAPLKLLCGSGCEEAAVIMRKGLQIAEVKSVAVPREGGMKDLTAMGLIDSLGWGKAEQLRFPSGDGAIISFFGQGADAASMVEPYATMLEMMEFGKVVRRTGNIWPGAPGCSLATSAHFIDEHADIVQKVVNAYVRAEKYVHQHPAHAVEAAVPYIGVNARFIEGALKANKPDVNAVRNQQAMQRILTFMQQLGYIQEIPHNFMELGFLDNAQKKYAR